MPNMCFSYPPETGNREPVPPVRDSKICFSYQGGVVQPPPESKLCFSYVTSHCFRY